MKKKLIAIKVPPTPYTEYLNGEYRQKLIELLKAHGFKHRFLSAKLVRSLEYLAYKNKLICMLWDNEA